MKLFLMESSLQLKWLLWFNHKEVKPLYDNLVATGSQYLESNTVKYRKLSTTKIIKFLTGMNIEIVLLINVD